MNTQSIQIDPSAYRQVLGHYPTGVCVITYRDIGGACSGVTVGSFTSVSLTPPLVAFFLMRGSASGEAIAAAGKFCVNVLASDQNHLGRHFASRRPDKCADVAFDLSDQHLPLLAGCVAAIECEVETVLDAGDHIEIRGRVLTLKADSAKPPLVYWQGRYLTAHHPA